MKIPCLFALTLPALALLALPAAAAPVHISLKASAAAAPNADGFLTLGSVAAISGGDKAARARFAAVSIARAPLPGETRQLTRGDLALKLRQAGINPDTQAVLEGADRADVTAEDGPEVPANKGVGETSPRNSVPIRSNPQDTLSLLKERVARDEPGEVSPSPPLSGAGGTLPVVVHSGDVVTVLIQSGAMTITAPAVARENGKAGDTIRVHRDGVMTDLLVQVVDAQTVQLEI